MVIEFDENGNLTNNVKLTVKEIKKHFVDSFNGSETRKDIYNSYLCYAADLQKIVNEPFSQIVNGSYSTKKHNPNDIDLVNFIDSEICNENIDAITRFTTRYGSKNQYQVDGYIVPNYPKNDPRFQLVTQKRFDYWNDLFGSDRNGNQKGYIITDLTR